MYARIIEGRVAELSEVPFVLGPSECADIRKVPSDTCIGWELKEGRVVEPDFLLDALEEVRLRYEKKREYVKDRLWVQMVNGNPMWESLLVLEEDEMASVIGGL